MRSRRRSWRELLLLGLILAAGAALRLYGLNWDGGQWLHPDERQIYFITNSLRWPRSLAEALSPNSPLNPGFFAYGSLPFYLLKWVAVLLSSVWPAVRDPDNLHLVGRPLAALFDLGTVVLTYRLARRLGEGSEGDSGENGVQWGALFAAALVSLAVLPIQLAHFYTADPLLAFTVMLTLNLAADVARGAGGRRQAALGVALGLALATKVSAAPLILVVCVAFKEQGTDRSRSRVSRSTLDALLTLTVAGLVTILAQPYALIDGRTFLADTVRESQIAWGRLDVPYTRQYAGTLPFLYSMWQTALWGVGLPLGLAGWAGLATALAGWLRRGTWAEALLLAWAGPYLAISGILHARYLRYMLPLVPVLCIVAARGLVKSQASDVKRRSSGLGRWRSVVGPWLLVAATLAYAVAFAGIYHEPHSWIAASEWVYRQVPAGSTLAVEDWDTPLPLPLDVDGRPRRIEEYDLRVLTLYAEPDGSAKWQGLTANLAASDYLIVASRRLYGSIPRLPDRYPVASSYYERLFAGDLGFELVAEFTRGPAWLNPRIPPLPGAAPAILRPDESFVVYDHPRALILRNAQHLPAADLLRRLEVPVGAQGVAPCGPSGRPSLRWHGP